MYTRKSKLSTLLLLLVDCIAIFCSLVLSNYLRSGRLFYSDNERMDFGLALGIMLLCYLAMNLLRNTNRKLLLRGPFHELLHVGLNNLLLLACSQVGLYFLGVLDAYSRLAFLYFVLIDTGLMFVLHLLWKKLLPYMYRTIGELRRVLLIADTQNAASLVADMKGMKDYSYEVIGIVLTDSQDTADVGDVPVVTTMDNLITYCQQGSLDEVMVAISGGNQTLLKSYLEVLAQMGITLHYHLPVPELKGASNMGLSQFGRYYMVTYANRVAPMGQLLLKRLLDVVGGLVGCVFLVIVFLIFAPLIKLESKGPVFFGQKRVGRNGRIFKMYKFRSMYADAEQRKQELMAQNEMSGFMFKMENDPRITKIGKFMRKTSLDEFPQFINILKGDMSLVGTRPPTLDEFSHYSPYHKKRLSFRPGLTGMWQVSGRSDITDFEEIVRLDVEYIDQWSFLLDIKILVKTVLQVFKKEGAR